MELWRRNDGRYDPKDEAKLRVTCTFEPRRGFMCGRFPQALQYRQYRRAVTPQLPDQAPPRGTRGADNYRASYNVAPNSNVAVVRAPLPNEKVQDLLNGASLDHDDDSTDPEASGDEPRLLIQSMRWGFLPHYQKHSPEYKDTLNTINARSDVLLGGSPMWGRPFSKGQRCVVFTQGFYEWQKAGGGKIPHFIGMDQIGQGRQDKAGEDKMLMPMAGLWEKCHIEGEEEPRYTFTIMTTDVSSQLSFLHDRQPLILDSPEAIAVWLDPTAPLDIVRKVIKTFEGPLEYYKVPTEVGKVGNDDAAFIKPVEQRKDGLMAAFGRASGKQHSAGTHQRSAAVSQTSSSNKATKNPVEPQNSADQSTKDTNSETHAPAPTLKEVKAEQSEPLDETRESKHNVKTANGRPSQPPVDPTHRGGSSRWSPDPFDPPVSPSRPNGGYSTVDDPRGGLSKYGKVSHDDGGSHGKRKASPEKVKMGDGALEGAFKKQKVKQEVQEAVRDFEASDAADGPLSPTSGGKAAAPTNQGAAASPTGNHGSNSPSNARSSPSKDSARRPGHSASSPKRSPHRKDQGDIRSFFGKG